MQLSTKVVVIVWLNTSIFKKNLFEVVWSTVQTTGRSHPFSTQSPSAPSKIHKETAAFNRYISHKIPSHSYQVFSWPPHTIPPDQLSSHTDSHLCICGSTDNSKNLFDTHYSDNKIRTSSLGSFANIFASVFLYCNRDFCTNRRHLSSPLELKESGVKLTSKKQLPISFSIPCQQWSISGRKPLPQILNCMQNKPTHIYSMLKRHQKGRVWDVNC